MYMKPIVAMIGGTSALEITRPTRKPHAIPIASAIEARGRDIKVVTIDCSNPDTRTMITEGTIDAACAQQPVTIGRIGLQTMLSIIRGEPYETKIYAPVQAVTAADIGTLDLSGIVIPE